MKELGNELQGIEREIKKLANKKDKLTKAEKQDLHKLRRKFRNHRVAKAFNSQFEGDLTEEQVARTERNLRKKAHERHKEFKKNKEISKEDRLEVAAVRREISAALQESRENGTQDSTATRVKLARLRAQFNRAMQKAENKAERASQSQD